MTLPRLCLHVAYLAHPLSRLPPIPPYPTELGPHPANPPLLHHAHHPIWQRRRCPLSPILRPLPSIQFHLFHAAKPAGLPLTSPSHCSTLPLAAAVLMGCLSGSRSPSSLSSALTTPPACIRVGAGTGTGRTGRTYRMMVGYGWVTGATRFGA